MVTNEICPKCGKTEWRTSWSFEYKSICIERLPDGTLCGEMWNKYTQEETDAMIKAYEDNCRRNIERRIKFIEEELRDIKRMYE